MFYILESMQHEAVLMEVHNTFKQNLTVPRAEECADMVKCMVVFS